MHREQIKELALANGFKLKPQPDGSEDLNPYVYEFAAALTEHMQQQNEYLSALVSGQPLYDMEEKIADLMARNKALREEVERLTDTNKQFGKIIHNQVVANQAAWIEWQRGKGAEAAMAWVHNGLWGPGQIPDESEPWANDPQAYYDANQADPLPVCPCGRPSNQLWMGHGACCSEHMEEIERKVKADE